MLESPGESGMERKIMETWTRNGKKKEFTKE